MYSINLAKITLAEFEKILLSAQLLPSQRLILSNLALNMQRLKTKGIKNLQELQALLKKKKNYPVIAEDTGIGEDYLVILNRMVNSYVVKEVPLIKLGIFNNEEISILAGQNIKTTRQYYDSFISNEQKAYLREINIPPEKLKYALHIIDLLRVNGIGVEYAKILYEMGIKSVADYNKTPSEAILKSFQELNKNKEYSKATLGIADIDYCRRFSEKLDCEL